MNHSPKRGRVLICGPSFGAHRVNGLRDVIHDLAAGLRDRGWEVDTLVNEHGGGVTVPPPDFVPRTHRLLSRLSRPLHLPKTWKQMGGMLLSTRAHARRLSEQLFVTERRIKSGEYDVILACVDSSPLGLASLVTRVHLRHVLVSLDSVCRELLFRRWLALVGPLARRLTGRWCHPDLYLPFAPSKACTVVFASRSWRDDGVAAGLSGGKSAVIHFGVPITGHLVEPVPVRSPVRLLWAGRLMPGKGLHFFLPALSSLRHQLSFQLTIVAGDGPHGYREQIVQTIRSLDLTDVTKFRQPVSRALLPGLFADHDLFLFYSEFAEPVAQMLLLAFAHGLVVVASSTGGGGSTLITDDTVFPFTDTSAPVVAGAIRRAVSDVDARARIRARAHEIASSEHSLPVTIAKYDDLLTDVANRPLDRLHPGRHDNAREQQA